MGKSGIPPKRAPERKVKRLDDEIMEYVCELCEGRGEEPAYIWEDKEHECVRTVYRVCPRCEGTGVIYAEE